MLFIWIIAGGFVYKFLVISILHLIFSTQSFAKIIYVLDFDNTIFDDSNPDSSWKTPWVLKKVSMVNSSAQLGAVLSASPVTIQITPAEYANFQNMWAKDKTTLGSLTEVQLQTDAFLSRPKTIVPGYYRIDENTFEFYKTGLNGENHLAQNYIQAKERVRRKRTPNFDFLGNAFPIFKKAMSDPSTVGDVHIFTAREQTSDEFQMLFEMLEQDKLIMHTTGINKRGLDSRPTIHQLQGYESILYGRSLSQNKKSVIQKLVTHLSMSTSDLTDDFSAEQEKMFQMVKTHTLLVAEDDPINIREIATLMRELSYGHTTRKIKLVLLNTAPLDVINNLSPPFNQQWIVFDQGYIRAAHKNEIQNYTGETSLTSTKNPGGKYCGFYLKGSTRGDF